MPANTSADGRFCWFELGTTDQKAAKAFYTSIFGWTPHDTAMGPGHHYTVFKIGDDEVAAAYTLQPEMLKERIPPHWMVYMRVPSADDAAAKAAALGGTVMKPAFDVGSNGRMAVLKDPTGAMFCVWQTISNPGVMVSGPAGTAVWADLDTPDQMLAAGFYQKLFGWKIVDGKQMNVARPGDYAHIVNGDDFIGGISPAEHRNPNTPAHWLTYFEVADYPAAILKIKSQGDRVHFEHEMKDVRRYAVCADAQGATFAIVHSLRHG